MRGYIYMVVNKINDKSYIGKTYSTTEIRWKQHCREYKRVTICNRPLYRAMNKYGIEAFEVLQLGKFEEGELEKQEIYFIGLFDTYRNGYNATLGGDGTKIYTFSKKEIEKAIKNADSISDASRKLKVDPSTLRKYVKAYNLQLPKINYAKIYCKVTKAQAYRIKYGGESTKKLNKEFNLKRGVVSRIRTGKTWRNI